MPHQILLVEDTPLNQKLISRMLKRRGFAVEVAENGAVALDAVAHALPDLILMDLGMPVMDGYETTRRLKADPQTRAIPVIAVTAHTLPGDREKAMRAGCDAYASKPVDFARLFDTMHTFLAGVGERL